MMNVLVIAPHPDDEILGVGGTMAKRILAGHNVYVCIVTKGVPPVFSTEFVEKGRAEARKAHEQLGVTETFFLDFPAVMLEQIPRYELNGKIHDVVQKVKPQEVYIPHRGDMQIDHQMITDAAMVALRPKYQNVVERVYVYETLSETGWNIPNVTNEFIPNVYEDITTTLEAKKNAMKQYQSQLGEFPNPRSVGTLEALAKFRGSTVNVLAAEAFQLVREIKVR